MAFIKLLEVPQEVKKYNFTLIPILAKLYGDAWGVTS